MINNFKNADKTETHAQTQKTSGVTNEWNECNVLILRHAGVVRILDVNVENRQILFCIVEKKIHQIGFRGNWSNVGHVVVLADVVDVVQVQYIRAGQARLEVWLEDNSLNRIVTNFCNLLQNITHLLAIGERLPVKKQDVGRVIVRMYITVDSWILCTECLRRMLYNRNGQKRSRWAELVSLAYRHTCSGTGWLSSSWFRSADRNAANISGFGCDCSLQLSGQGPSSFPGSPSTWRRIPAAPRCRWASCGRWPPRSWEGKNTRKWFFGGLPRTSSSWWSIGTRL